MNAIDRVYEYYALKINDRKHILETVDSNTMEFLENILKMNPVANDPVVKEITEKHEISEKRANEILNEIYLLAETKID